MNNPEFHILPRTKQLGSRQSAGEKSDIAKTTGPTVHIEQIRIENRLETSDYRTLSLQFSLHNLEVSECDVQVGFVGASTYPVVSCQIAPTSLRISPSVEAPRFRYDGSVSFPFDPWTFPSCLVFHVRSAGRSSYVLRTNVDLLEDILHDVKDRRLVDALGSSSDDSTKTHEAILQHLRFLRGQSTRKTESSRICHASHIPHIERYAPTERPHDSHEPRRVCVVTQDVLGPIRNGGMGTWCAGVAGALRNAGHDVTMLYTQEYFEQGNKDLWVHHYKAQGISLEFLPESQIDAIGWPAVTLSSRVYEWLKERSFDVVHFQEMNGYGYYSLLAKRAGLSFTDTTLCVGLHGPARWHRCFNKQFVCWQEELARYWMEKECLRLADVAFSPSQYLFSWATEEGWELPERCWILPHPLPELSWQDSSAEMVPTVMTSAVRRSPPSEFVFFGRLESRKGLELFCDALDLLGEEFTQDLRVTFIGKPGVVRRMGALEYLERRVRNWLFSVNVMSDLSRDDAMEYLSRGNKVVVIPSLADSTSYTLYECLQEQIPVLCANNSGLPELIHEEDREAVTFLPEPGVLAKKLEDVLVEGAVVPRAIYDFSRVNEIWQQFHEQHLFPPRRDCPTESREFPLVSICIVHHNRPELLELALDSVFTQTYRNIEVIVVDDGSTVPDLENLFERMKQRFTGFPLEFVRGKNRFPGASRNIAVGFARGEYVLFLDDDNIMKSTAVDTLIKAAQASGAEVVSPFYDIFSGVGDPRASDIPCARWLLAGPGLAMGVASNGFGDSFSLFARTVFLRLGGFSEDRANDTEDWELLVRVNLAGFSHMIVPEALLWYRRAPDNFRRINVSYPAMMRRLRPYAAEVSDRLFDVLLVTCGMEQESARIIRELLKSAEGGRESWLRAEFYSSQSILFSTSQPGGFDGIVGNEEIQIRTGGKRLEITATGVDPQLFLPSFDGGFAEHLCMRIRITAPTETFIQVFYTASGQADYSEELSSIAPIRQGFSEVYLPIPEPLFEGRIRLDPGGQPGDYILHSIEVRGCSA